MSLNQWARTAMGDFKYALRTLRRSPGYMAVAAMTLALGIGANTAIFSLLDQILLRLLPVKNPQQLVLLTMRSEEHTSELQSRLQLVCRLLLEKKTTHSIYVTE